jgi:hypothetical protein
MSYNQCYFSLKKKKGSRTSFWLASFWERTSGMALWRVPSQKYPLVTMNMLRPVTEHKRWPLYCKFVPDLLTQQEPCHFCSENWNWAVVWNVASVTVDKFYKLNITYSIRNTMTYCQQNQRNGETDVFVHFCYLHMHNLHKIIIWQTWWLFFIINDQGQISGSHGGEYEV